MKSSVKNKSPSLPSRPTSRAAMPSIRLSLPANFRNDAIRPESESKEKDDKDWSTEKISESPEEEEDKISIALMSPSHDPEWLNNVEYFIRKVIRCHNLFGIEAMKL